MVLPVHAKLRTHAADGRHNGEDRWQKADRRKQIAEEQKIEVQVGDGRGDKNRAPLLHSKKTHLRSMAVDAVPRLDALVQASRGVLPARERLVERLGLARARRVVVGVAPSPVRVELVQDVRHPRRARRVQHARHERRDLPETRMQPWAGGR